MYGLVNKAVQDLVVTQFGQDKWEAIKEKAGISVDAFLSMKSYPDDITYSLVGAASDILDLTPAQVLEAFGEYWTIYTAKEGYGELLSMSGSSFVEFLQNLDNLHARVGLSFPELKPPSFHCSDLTENSVRLHYESDREGLTPFVVGLLKGLGTMFNTTVDVSVEARKDQGHPYDEFLIRFEQQT